MKTFTFLRHGHAEPKVTDDKSRKLDHDGHVQANRRRELLKNPHFDLVLVSSAVRSRETGKIIGDKEEVRTRVLPELYAEGFPKQKILNNLFKTYGQALLTVYFKNSHTEEKTAMWEYADLVWRAIDETSRGRTNILVIGHEFLLPLTLITTIPARCKSEATDMLYNNKFGECEGFRLTFNSNEKEFATFELITD